MDTSPYDPIADWYDEKVRRDWNGHAQTLPHLLELTEDIAGSDVCDVACGQGTITRKLAEAGGRVVGVDTSQQMLGLAQAEEDGRPLGINYLQDDARRLRSLPDESFDLASCLHSITRVLRVGGAFVFCITHPCFTGPGAGWKDNGYLVGSYLEEGFWVSENPDGVRSRVGAHHRTLSTYVNELVAAGLAIERLLEPSRVHAGTSLPHTRQVPGSLYMRCRKPLITP
jgi:SAM-dependent methyltransferase